MLCTPSYHLPSSRRQKKRFLDKRSDRHRWHSPGIINAAIIVPPCAVFVKRKRSYEKKIRRTVAKIYNVA